MFLCWSWRQWAAVAVWTVNMHVIDSIDEGPSSLESHSLIHFVCIYIHIIKYHLSVLHLIKYTKIIRMSRFASAPGLAEADLVLVRGLTASEPGSTGCLRGVRWSEMQCLLRLTVVFYHRLPVWLTCWHEMQPINSILYLQRYIYTWLTANSLLLTRYAIRWHYSLLAAYMQLTAYTLGWQ